MGGNGGRGRHKNRFVHRIGHALAYLQHKPRLNISYKVRLTYFRIPCRERRLSSVRRRIWSGAGCTCSCSSCTCRTWSWRSWCPAPWPAGRHRYRPWRTPPVGPWPGESHNQDFYKSYASSHQAPRAWETIVPSLKSKQALRQWKSLLWRNSLAKLFWPK